MCICLFRNSSENKDDEIIIPYTCVVLLFIKCFHVYIAIWKDPCHNNPVRLVRCVLLSHFTDEETKAPGGKGIVQSHPGRTPDSWSCGLSTVATTELLPTQRLRLRSAQRAAALSEPKAGLRNPGQQSQPCHRRNHQKPTFCSNAGRLFPVRSRSPAQAQEQIKPRVTQAFILPDSKRDFGCQGS